MVRSGVTKSIYPDATLRPLLAAVKSFVSKKETKGEHLHLSKPRDQ